MRTLLIFFLLFGGILSAKIIETFNISSVDEYVIPDILIIYDLDNTLIEPPQLLGSDQWVTHRMQEYEKKGLSFEESKDRTIDEWMAIQHFTDMCPVENYVVDLIRKQQDKKIAIMGLTSRKRSIATRTINQLKAVGINLETTALSKGERILNAEDGIIHTGGVLFTSGNCKGSALAKWFRLIGHKPKAVLCIDDKRRHLEKIEEHCNLNLIPFTGLRYGYLDAKVKSFDKALADMQMSHFGRLIPDEDAQKLLACS